MMSLASCVLRRDPSGHKQLSQGVSNVNFYCRNRRSSPTTCFESAFQMYLISYRQGRARPPTTTLVIAPITAAICVAVLSTHLVQTMILLSALQVY
jgi:hypothetical protein